MQIKGCHGRYVAIKPFQLQDQPHGGLQKTEVTREQEVKKQNRGEILLMGEKCDNWIQPGDHVSFYRNAATPIDVDGEEIFLIHEDHILVKFE